ncbi:unnamed protein product [Brachionus calyciflorus]|uniref:Uncharacterized protein n=1 Tax=Brachionus calyciflorus TaxID=104777 RepID=A0A814HWS4_9BILA|nr:unnamed protein product [Brachionus calyciflorus]
MKYTNKRVVIPYNSLISQNKREDTNRILSNKSLTTDDKIAALNYKIQRQLLKNKSNKEIEQEIDNLDNKNNLNDQILDDESQD